jgi:chitin disaccharide deacetylase
MLIVNADDFGAGRNVTDPILEMLAAGVVSSTSAMVWMSDTARAASLARERSAPVGLHLNFTFPFNATAVPPPVRERQLRLTKIFGRESWRGDSHANPDRQLLVDAIEDQLACFCETFGRPTHIDGHHHVHTHPAVLEHLPRDLPIRPVLSVPSRENASREERNRQLRRRFLSPEMCFAFEDVHPLLGGAGLEALEHARRHSLEIMVHPKQEHERAALMSAQWREALSALTVGSYADLARAQVAG